MVETSRSIPTEGREVTRWFCYAYNAKDFHPQFLKYLIARSNSVFDDAALLRGSAVKRFL